MYANVKFTLVSVAIGLLTVATGASGANAPERLSKECIGDPAYKAIEACPEGPKKFDQGKKHSAAFNSAPPPREQVKRKDELGSKQPDQEQTAGYRDTRKTRLKARARKLLITEIAGLEKLYQGTKKKAPDRPQIVRRLAEGYVELETAANRDKITADIAADEAKAKKQRNKYEKAKKDSKQASAILKRARSRAIRYYRIMKRDYPNYSKIDEILYYLAYEYEQAGDLQAARKVYLELIDRAPKSPYVPSAYLAFGELFFQEAMADPSKWALAESAYKQVINYPPPKNKVYGYARYKLAYVYWNSGDYRQAITEFKKVIEYANSYEKLPSAVQLRKAARRDLIPVYAVAGSPTKAYNFFKPLSGDKGGEDKQTIEMLNDLGLNYLDTGHYDEAIKLYQDLMSRDRGDRYCLYQTKITGAIQASKSSDKDRIRKELDTQLAIRKDFLAAKHDPKAQLECSNRTAELLAETAMSWHLEAVGSGGHRGTGDPKTMAHAAYLYQRVVDNFDQEDFAKFEFPRIVKEDWPNIYKIKYAMADLLYVQKRWEDCGPAFDAVVAANPQSAEAPEAAYASVLCYQKMYDQEHKGDEARQGRGLGPKGASKEDRKANESEWEKFKPKEFTDMQKGMIQAFNRYVCYIKPPKGDKKAEEQYVEVKYARARTYFEAQHWEEAALGFRDVALNHGDQDAAIYAAQLYLEAVNVLGSKSKPARPSCFEDMANDVPAFIEIFCSGAKYEDNKEQCDLLTRIQCDVRRLAAEKTVEAADEASVGALEMYKKGADAYLELFNEYGKDQLEAGGEAKCGKMDEILYNSAKAYQAARLLAKSIRVRMILLSPKYKLHETELAQKAIYEIGGNYQAIAVYDQAANYYMKYAEATKYRGEFADQAVSDAVVLHLGLGNEEEAISAAKAFNRNFGRRKPKQAAQIAFAVGAHYGEAEDWKAVVTQLKGAMGLIDKQASLDVKVQAHALLARAHQNLKQPAARTEYGKVVGAWKDPKAAASSIPDQRNLGRALTAVGEALFYFAEIKREAAEKVKFPEYKGKGTKEDVLKHIQTKVADWIKKKQPLIIDASNEYKKIVDLQPVPPPQWVIAGGARVGGLWGQFVADFRAAPIPTYMKQDYELRTAYYGALDDASEPIKQQAKGAYNTCLEYSVKYQYFDQYSRSCEKWLAENYKSDYHLIDEFSGAPNRVNSVLHEAPNPLLISGEPYVPTPKEPVKDAKDKKKGDKDEEK